MRIDEARRLGGNFLSSTRAIYYTYNGDLMVDTTERFGALALH